MALFTDAQLIIFLYSFWLPAHIAHLIFFIIANKDDIYLDWKIFFLGDLGGWGLVCGVTALFVYIIPATPEWVILTFYGIHILLISTLLTDVSMSEESISLTNLKAYVLETLVESILIPWAAGIVIGAISASLIHFL
ncbi:hypothetical protein DSAG12_01058 [Promethearchaeum syntrophicum]|uniref:Uncharacterized protein n=1 Tax=Promethearchaeum syntrophicum TaxID=2594042 RepID=A0A5B9D7Y3_9ARCH|nr:hypothetical protein [Candidatus Prometheoarchaeum syntrophicum]QEE15234.1 hypothetical protein DSAG12_01058 [Candidatus Prometheoarchaeum syntrophicum]